MFAKNRITEVDRERLDGELYQVHLAALQVELKDLDHTARQLKALRAAVDAMTNHVQALRGKWFPGADDEGHPTKYRPGYETRQEVRS